MDLFVKIWKTYWEFEDTFNASLVKYGSILDFALLLITIGTLVYLIMSVSIARETLNGNARTLDIMRKDFERRYRSLKVGIVEYYFADYRRTNKLAIAIFFLNISQQDIIVYELNISFRDNRLAPLKFELLRLEDVRGNTVYGEVRIPPGKKRRATYNYPISEKEKKSFAKLSLKGSQLSFSDNNSHNYSTKTILDRFQDVIDDRPDVKYT